MTKTIDTVVEDIYALFDTPHQAAPDNVVKFVQELSQIVVNRLGEDRSADPYLRISNMGKGDRQVYYECNPHGKEEPLEAHTRIKFLYGDVIEALLIFLAREAGHEVTEEQGTVDIDGVIGHTDGKLDGKVFDVKSASSYSFKKFKNRTILNEGEDAFGYIPQLSGYNHALGGEGESAYFLVQDKQLGHLTLMEVPDMVQIDAPARVAHMKEVVASDTPPPRCHEPVPDGKSGNMKLGVNCSYCRHKWECWDGLRAFIYSGGPRYLTHVEVQPKVPELVDGELVEVNDG
jgi:hypothetical protein|tara:strand:- start:84 stop:950 length:867 start_codon:yes stop_codon:yes gene_type:complete